MTVLCLVQRFMSAHALISMDYFWLVVVQVPNVSWNDVGGLEDVKRELQETVQVSQKRDYFSIESI